MYTTFYIYIAYGTLLQKKITLLVFNLNILVVHYLQFKYQKGSGRPAF